MSMTRFYAIGFCILMVFDTFSQVCFKFTALHAAPFAADAAWLLRVLHQPWMYGAVIGYLGAFVTWMTLLRRLSVGPAFAASHLELVGVMAISWPLFGEAISLQQSIGAAFIIAGVVCLALSESETASATTTEREHEQALD